MRALGFVWHDPFVCTHDSNELDTEVKLRNVFERKNQNADEHCESLLPAGSFQGARNVKWGVISVPVMQKARHAPTTIRSNWASASNLLGSQASSIGT